MSSKAAKDTMKDKTRASDDKECKKEAAINRSIRKANYGDPLWVQLHGSSWWPAQVVDDSTISAIRKPRERREGEVLVRLYGSYKYLFVDPISSHLEFKDTLEKYSGSYDAILEESLKQDLHQLKFGTSKKKEMKKKGKVEADVSQERIVKKKKNVMSKTGTKKVPSSGHSSSRELAAKSPAKRSKETSLGSAGAEEDRSRKRKRDERSKKSKSNSKRSASRKEEQDMECKKPKANGAVSRGTSLGRASVGATHKTSLKSGSLSSDRSERGNNKKQKQSETQRNASPSTPHSKPSRPQRSANQGHSLSGKMGSSRTKVQTPNTVQKKLQNGASKDAGKRKNAKASKQEILSTTLEETPKEPSARKLKVMRFLGLVSPAGSPFIQNGSISHST